MSTTTAVLTARNTGRPSRYPHSGFGPKSAPPSPPPRRCRRGRRSGRDAGTPSPPSRWEAQPLAEHLGVGLADVADEEVLEGLVEEVDQVRVVGDPGGVEVSEADEDGCGEHAIGRAPSDPPGQIAHEVECVTLKRTCSRTSSGARLRLPKYKRPS